MDVKNKESRLLFFKYAIPCAETLAKRGFITQRYRKKLMKNVIFNKKIPKDTEKIFKIANIMCEKIAKKLGKKFIDKDVIRKYFLFEHDKIVDKRYKMFKDFDSLQCRLYSGKVINLKNRKIIVHTIIGNKKYKNIFIPNLKIGNFVVVHRDFIIEKINENLAKRLWGLKEKYFKSTKSNY